MDMERLWGWPEKKNNPKTPLSQLPRIIHIKNNECRTTQRCKQNKSAERGPNTYEGPSGAYLLFCAAARRKF